MPLAVHAQGRYIFLRHGISRIVPLEVESSIGEAKSPKPEVLVGKINEVPVANLLQHLWNDECGQDIAEYAVMLAVILVIVVGTIRLIGSNANNVFSQVGSSIQ